MCQNFPCAKYETVDEYDIFITSRNRFRDFEKMDQFGIEAYMTEQREKIVI